jgi:hypothetical protein
MAKRIPSEAQDASVATPRARRAPRQADSPRDIHYEEPSSGVRPPMSMSEADDVDPSHDDIRLRAYHKYLERGGGHGLDFEDWLEAERELKQKR